MAKSNKGIIKNFISLIDRRKRTLYPPCTDGFFYVEKGLAYISNGCFLAVVDTDLEDSVYNHKLEKVDMPITAFMPKLDKFWETFTVENRLVPVDIVALSETSDQPFLSATFSDGQEVDYPRNYKKFLSTGKAHVPVRTNIDSYLVQYGQDYGVVIMPVVKAKRSITEADYSFIVEAFITAWENGDNDFSVAVNYCKAHNIVFSEDVHQKGKEKATKKWNNLRSRGKI